MDLTLKPKSKFYVIFRQGMEFHLRFSRVVLIIYTITIFNLVVPTCSVLEGDPLSGNGRGSPNQI